LDTHLEGAYFFFEKKKDYGKTERLGKWKILKKENSAKKEILKILKNEKLDKTIF